MTQILNREVTDPTGQKLYVSGATPQDVNTAITAQQLTPQTPITPATPPPPANLNTDGTGAMIKANEPNLTPPASTEPTVPDWLTQLMKGNEGSKTAVGDLYKSTYGVSPDQTRTQQQTAQTDLNTQNAAVQTAQEKYNALNAQIQGLDYQQSTVVPNQAQQDATGRGITAAGLAPITAAQQRQVLLQKAPLQYQALLAQAELANAQGKATLASGILKQANDHLDSLFTAQKEDITNAVTHQNSNFDKIATYLTEKEKEKVAEMRATTAANTTQANNFINDVQAAIKEARTSGDTALAGSISKLATVPLNPTSKTFAQDYAKANADLTAKLGQIQAKQTGGMSGTLGGASFNVPNVSMNATGIANPVEQSAFLKSLPTDVATLVHGLANYTINPSSFSTRLYKGTAGMTQSDILALVQQYDPTYDAKQFATRSAMQKNIASGAIANAVTAANTVIHHLDSLSSTASALGNGTFSALNAGKNFFQSVGGSALQNNFNVMADAVASEMAKVYKGTGAPTENEIKDWRARLNVNMSPQQINGAIQSMISLLAGKLATVSDNYYGVMGTPLSNFGGGYQILTDSSAKVLESMGIDPRQVDPTYGQKQQTPTAQPTIVTAPDGTKVQIID